MSFSQAIMGITGFREMVEEAELIREDEQMKWAKEHGEEIENQEHQKTIQQRYESDEDFGSW